MLYNIDTEIAGLARRIEAGQIAAERIENNRAERARTEPLETDLQRLRARRRGYDATKRAKLERARVRQLMDIRARLIEQRDAERVAAALAAL